MDLEMVLNELSLKTPASDEQTARKLMSELISTVRQATVTGVKRVIRTSDEINTIELAPNYPVVRWRNDNEVDLEERRFFRTLATKAPFWVDLAEQIKNDFDLSDVLYQGETARGLCFALISDALPVSLRSENRWDGSRLELLVTRLEDEELIEEYLEIVHVSCKHHVQELAEWIENRTHLEIFDGSDLWKRRNELFPRLEFCEDLYKQMQNLRNGDPMLRQVVKRLTELEKYCEDWTSGNFNPDRLPSKVTPESQTRLQQLKQQLTFECPDGTKRIFSFHVRITPGAWRLHFSEALGPGKLIIGYIGSKIQ